ncbi:MAG: efflux RND transporter periplasmic adaptor subunit [Flavobacterium sp.]|nr:MAG: efflux RND transporter periplasmic adaptor subunit [Flavobacterium sp.]
MLRAIYILFIILLLANSCKNNESVNDTSTNGQEAQSEILTTITKEQFDAVNMQTGSIVSMDFPEHIYTTGFIDVPPANKAIINAFAGGYIKSTPLLVGNSVKKGQLLVTIENPEFIELQQQFLEADEQLSYLKNEFERQKSLYNERITSEKNYLKAESEYKRTLAIRNSLDKKLRLFNIDPANVKKGVFVTTARIYAPIEGSITKIYVNQGSYVSPADKIMEIVNLDHIHLELDVFEKDIMRVEKSQEIEFRIPESSNKTYKGEVHLIGSEIDLNKRTVKVHGHFDDMEENNFAIGMFVEADIVTAKKPVDALPESAVIEIGDTKYVLKLVEEKDNLFTFEKIEIATSRIYNKYVALDNNHKFSATDTFLVKGAYGIVRE